MSRDDLADYVVRLPPRAREPLPVPPPEDEHPLAAGGGRAAQAVFSALLVAGGLLGAFAAPFVLALLAMVTMSSSSGSAGIVFGVCILVGGLAAGLSSWAPWRRSPSISVSSRSLRIHYPGFRRPFVVARELVRVVSTDERPTVLFQRNDRFPVVGDVPEGSFVDALDTHPASPWEPADPEHRRLFPFPSPPQKPDHQHIFSSDGSALPFLRVNPSDIPNVAIVFESSVKTPRVPLGVALFGRVPLYAGGRTVRGVLLRALHPGTLAAAFEPWGVVRPITSDDVVEEGLLLPKPLRGMRALAYGLMLFIPVILQVVLRHRSW